MFKENPQSVDDKEAVAMKLSEEWRQIKSNMQQEIPKSNTNVSHTLIGELTCVISLERVESRRQG